MRIQLEVCFHTTNFEAYQTVISKVLNILIEPSYFLRLYHAVTGDAGPPVFDYAFTKCLFAGTSCIMLVCA